MPTARKDAETDRRLDTEQQRLPAAVTAGCTIAGQAGLLWGHHGSDDGECDVLGLLEPSQQQDEVLLLVDKRLAETFCSRELHVEEPAALLSNGEQLAKPFRLEKALLQRPDL